MEHHLLEGREVKPIQTTLCCEGPHGLAHGGEEAWGQPALHNSLFYRGRLQGDKEEEGRERPSRTHK